MNLEYLKRSKQGEREVSIEEIGKLLKDRIRKLESGKCRMLSKGDECDCNLCLLEKRVM